MKLMLILITLLQVTSIFGQQDLTPKQIVFFQKKQVNVVDYEFDNDVINNNIQQALKLQKKQKILGLMSIPVGMGWLGYTAYIPAKKFIDNRKSDVLIPTTTNNTYLIISSTLFTATSSLLISHLIQKEKLNKKLRLIVL